MSWRGLSTARRHAVVTQLVVPLLLRGAGLNLDQRVDPRPFVERCSPAQAKSMGKRLTYVHIFFLLSVVLWLRMSPSSFEPVHCQFPSWYDQPNGHEGVRWRRV